MKFDKFENANILLFRKLLIFITKQSTNIWHFMFKLGTIKIIHFKQEKAV